MKVRKKLYSFVCMMLAAAIFFGTNAVNVFAVTSYPYGSVVLSELNKMSWDGAGQKSNASLDSTVKYQGAAGTVKYNLGTNGSTYWSINKSLGELGSGSLKIRFYSKDVGAKCAFVFRNSTTGVLYGWKPIEVEQEGWNVFSLSSGESMFKKAVEGSADQIVFNGYGFNLGTQFLGKSINIDSAWFEYPTDKWGSMDVVSASIADGQSYVSENLDGSNTLTFEFENELWDGIGSDAVSVYEVDEGTEEAVSVPYTVNAEGNKLKVIFADALPSPMEYKVVLEPNRIFDNSGRVLKTKYVLTFLVGKGGVLEITGTSVLDGTGYVPKNIDGSNTVYFEFENTLSDTDFRDAVKVYEVSDGQKTETDCDYTVISEGNRLKLVFDDELKATEYKIVLLPNIISDELGGRLIETYELGFFVESGPSSFYLQKTSAESDKPVDGGVKYEYTLVFNSILPEQAKEKITVYCGASKLYDGFKLTIDGRSATISFDKTEYSSVYYIKLADDFSDKSGKNISGEKIFSFKTKANAQAVSEADWTVIYSSGSDSVFSGGKFTDENANLYDKTTRYDFDATAAQKTVVIQKQYDISNMKFLNCWIYSPEKSGKNINFVLYADDTTAYDYVQYPMDWQGWKLCSIPLSSFPKASAAGTLYKLVINLGGFGELWEYESYILIDEIWLSIPEAKIPEIVFSSVKDGANNVPVLNSSITYSFNTEISSEQSGAIKVVNSQEKEFDDYTVRVESRTMTVRFGELVPSETYTVTLNNVFGKQPVKSSTPYANNFTTADSSCDVVNISFPNAKEFTAGEAVETEFTIKNSKETGAEITLNLNIYSDDGTLLKGEKEELTLAPQSGQVVERLSVDGVSNSGYAKAYVTAKDGHKLISDVYAVLNIAGNGLTVSETVNTDDASAGIDFEEVLMKGENLTVTGRVYNAKNALLIYLTDENGNTLAEEPVTAQSDGSFVYRCKFGESDNTMNVSAYAYGNGISGSTKMIYVSKEDRDKLTSLANGTSAQQLESFLESKAKYFGLADCQDALISDVAAILLENKTYTDYDNVIGTVESIRCIPSEFNSKIWSTLAKYIIANHKLLFNDSADYNRFSVYGETAQNEICIKLAKAMPFESVSAIRTKFSQVMNEDSDGGNQSVSVSGGGGGSGSVLSSASVPITSSAAENVFCDLDGFEWAKESILSLYSAGIIAGAADGKFRPADNILREEFVKLIVSMIYGNVDSVSHIFTDTDGAAWYAPYLSKAYETGIVYGRDDGSFGIGESITREDMVAMACRAVEVSGGTLTYGSETDFTDKDEISDYARAYVGALSGMGIINGTDNGIFAPKAFASRAEAARVISALYEFFK